MKVLTLGAQKYDDDNWKKVKPLKDRYFSAMMRHIAAWQKGEKFDIDDNEYHLAHAGCCVLFLLWADMQEEEGKC